MLKIAVFSDLQNDLVHPQGTFYVKPFGDVYDTGSSKLIPMWKKILAWMKHNADVIIYTGDWHSYADEEIDTINPNLITTFPPHCMGDSDSPDGALVLNEVCPNNLLTLGIFEPLKAKQHKLKDAFNNKIPVLFLKNKVSVWNGHPDFNALMEHLKTISCEDDITFQVCGVPADLAIDQFVIEARSRGHFVEVFKNAIMGYDEERVERCVTTWENSGITVKQFQIK